MNRVAELGIAVDTWAPPTHSTPAVNGTAPAGGAAAQGSNGARPGNGRAKQLPFAWAESLLQSFTGDAAGAQQKEQQPPGSEAEAAAAAAAGGQQQPGGKGAGLGPVQRLDPATMTRRINWLNSIRQWQEEFVGSVTGVRVVGLGPGVGSTGRNSM